MASSAAMAASRRISVYLEQGAKRTFACALDWPGWCRSARGDDAAVAALVDYAPRYARVAQRAGLALPRVSVEDVDVVETVPGDATTDFGAPSIVAPSDWRPVDARTARREVALLDAAWAELDAVVAVSPASLRKGPRGGGRDRDAMVQHVVNAERSYARKLGIGFSATEWRQDGVARMRARLREMLGVPWKGELAVPRGWPPRYLARRIAWHVLDHAWEMEDRSEPER